MISSKKLLLNILLRLEKVLFVLQERVKEKYINFDRNQFKANYPGLPIPAEVKKLWLAEMCNPNSKYLIDDPKESVKKLHLKELHMKYGIILILPQISMVICFYFNI